MKSLNQLSAQEVDAFIDASRGALKSHARVIENGSGAESGDFRAAITTVLANLAELLKTAPESRHAEIKALMAHYTEFLLSHSPSR